MSVKILLGPPGTGKTARLMQIMEDEMANGIEPDRIAFCSFTRKAAKEAQDRAMDIFRLKPNDFPYIRTLHSLAYLKLGVRRDEIMQPKDYKEIGEYLGIMFTNKNDFVEGLPPQKQKGDLYCFLDGYSRAKRISPEKAWNMLGDTDLNWYEFECYRDTVRAFKEDRGLIDFSDLLEADHEPLDIDVAIIDEAQDLSTLQWQFALNAFKTVQRLYIAGDDDQAIYTWSGADVRAFLRIPGDKEVLHQSHRVPETIHSLAEELVSRISERAEKQYKHNGTKGEVNFYPYLEDIDLSEGSWLLLARNNHMLARLSHLARSQGYLYSYRGSSAVNRAHIKAITLWEAWRKGKELFADEVEYLKDYLPRGLINWPNVIWHEILTGISDDDREFYRSLLRKGEKITNEVPRIAINTIHSVKGGEADHVILVSDMTQKTHDAMQINPNAEHRVWYVGATRAKKTLNIVTPQTRLAYLF